MQIEDWETRLAYASYQYKYLSWGLLGKMVVGALERMWEAVVYRDRDNVEIGHGNVEDLSGSGTGIHGPPSPKVTLLTQRFLEALEKKRELHTGI